MLVEYKNTKHNSNMIEESRQALQDIRRSLIELYASVNADPADPQEVARQLGLNRNMTWKLSRVLTADDPFATLNHLPGQQGIDLALKAFAQAGAGAAVLTPVQDAMKRMAEVIDIHAGDRETFELTLESSGVFAREDSVEGGREMAFRGNSMIWGLRSRARVVTLLAAPGPNDTVDFVQLANLIDFHRLRPNAKWRLFRLQIHNDAGGEQATSAGPEEIEPKAPGEIPLLLREFCSPNMPEIDVIDSPQGREYILPGGPVGKTGAFSCSFGYIARGLPMYASPENEYGSAAAAITLPAQTLVFDVLLHRDLKIGSEPELLIYGFPHGGIDSPEVQTVANLLPITAKLTELVGPPPAIATPLVPKYTQIVNRVYEKMGWKPNEFRGLRVVLPFPPMSSRVVMRWKLPERP